MKNETKDIALTLPEITFIAKVLSQITINAASEESEIIVTMVKSILSKINSEGEKE